MHITDKCAMMLDIITWTQFSQLHWKPENSMECKFYPKPAGRELLAFILILNKTCSLDFHFAGLNIRLHSCLAEYITDNVKIVQ